MKHGIQPEGEALRNAIRWLARDHDYSLEAVEAACQQFDLSPADEAFLMRHFLHADEGLKPPEEAD
ncbi:MAG: hypothetical protein ACE5F3_05895 [Mariprofundaceae bacterium]